MGRITMNTGQWSRDVEVHGLPGYETVGRTGQKLRTRNALKSAAAELIAEGHQPTVADVADAAGISKSTAYRYFPSKELMYAEVVLAATVDGDRQQVHEAAEGEGDATVRLDRTVRADHAFTSKHEHALRAGLRAYLLLIDTYPEAPLEPSHRVRYLTTALEPVADQLPDAAKRRLVAALSLVVGVEAALVTQVSCGLSADESETVKRWAADALLRAALQDLSSC
jgi:AcrR family transcriptional regulator